MHTPLNQQKNPLVHLRPSLVHLYPSLVPYCAYFWTSLNPTIQQYQSSNRIPWSTLSALLLFIHCLSKFCCNASTYSPLTVLFLQEHRLTVHHYILAVRRLDIHIWKSFLPRVLPEPHVSLVDFIFQPVPMVYVTEQAHAGCF